MAIGNFGKLITFETSDKKILTFREFKRDGEARWKKHERVGKRPLPQFLGPDLDTIKFTIVLDARHGVKPRSTMTNIRKHRNAGTPEYLVIKGAKVCDNRLVITKTSETWGEVWNKGELVRAEMEITMMEYPEK